MLESIIKEYENTDKNRDIQKQCAKQIYDYITDLKSIKQLLNKSVIHEMSIDSEKCYIELNDEYHNIRLIINDTDCSSIPIGIIVLGAYEPVETQIVLNILRTMDNQNKIVFLDIGANEGWYTLNVKKTFNSARVYSFEPSPITCERLKNNLLLNNEECDDVFQIGLFDKNDKMEFFYDKTASGASSFKNIQEKREITPIEVDVKCLDDWAREQMIDQVDFIKCDVEGAELFVYKGARNVIEKYKPVVFSEMLRKWSAKFSYTPNDIIDFFKELGYRCFVIVNETELKECLRVTEETVETNYIFLHERKHVDIITHMKRG